MIEKSWGKSFFQYLQWYLLYWLKMLIRNHRVSTKLRILSRFCNRLESKCLSPLILKSLRWSRWLSWDVFQTMMVKIMPTTAPTSKFEALTASVSPATGDFRNILGLRREICRRIAGRIASLLRRLKNSVRSAENEQNSCFHNEKIIQTIQ